MNSKTVLKYASDQGAKFVSVRFTDLPGSWQHLTFPIGELAEENIGVLRQVYREGHEIGNHTWTHPDISDISNRQMDLELNLTERLFAAKLGVQPLYFRPPYSIDQEPDTNDQAAPAACGPASRRRSQYNRTTRKTARRPPRSGRSWA